MDKYLGPTSNTRPHAGDDGNAALDTDILAVNFTDNDALHLRKDGSNDTFWQDIQGLSTSGLLNSTSDGLSDGDGLVVDLGLGSTLDQDTKTFSQQLADIQPRDPNAMCFSGAFQNETPASFQLRSLDNINGTSEDHRTAVAEPSKIGTRFSARSIRVLKTWLSNNSQNPYPTRTEIKVLERQTGLSKQQITNWLANSRRRHMFKMPLKRPPSPAITTATSRTIDIAENNRLPTGFDQMDPFQRWQVSPPEHEPVSAAAIAHAASDLRPGIYDPFESTCLSRSLSSSAGTSISDRSSANSAYSHVSNTSNRSYDPLRTRAMRRRRRRVPAQQPRTNKPDTLWGGSPQVYQCTFCTETFKTKHNWKRHEKSLHLSLERWECSPNGPTVLDAGGQLLCVFCEQIDPSIHHLESHEYSLCKDREAEDRTFYRKDHLQQHLKLVHNSKFTGWSMNGWRRENGMIRSRCGFCGLIMELWSERVDHLAEHFKAGKTMEGWRGDWGFDCDVLEMVENSIAPCTCVQCAPSSRAMLRRS